MGSFTLQQRNGHEGLSGSINKASAAFASSICAFYVLVVIIRKEKRAVDRRPNGFTKLLYWGKFSSSVSSAVKN